MSTLSPTVAAADGFVVVHRWKNAANPHAGRCFDEYRSLENAVAFYRSLGGGGWSDHEPIGIFASKGGLPVHDGAIPQDVIDAVIPGRARSIIGTVYCQNSPENCRTRERRHAQQEAELDDFIARVA